MHLPIIELEMAANLTTAILLVILFCFSVTLAARTKLYSSTSYQDDISVLSSSANDSICKSMVATQGYICQEHKVMDSIFSCFLTLIEVVFTCKF